MPTKKRVSGGSRKASRIHREDIAKGPVLSKKPGNRGRAASDKVWAKKMKKAYKD